jgi:hypothetical protein
MASYLFVDTISGAFMAGGAAQAVLSQLWKLSIIGLIFVWALIASPKLTALLALSLVWILIGPLVRLFAGESTDAFINDLTAGVKAVLPLMILCYCSQQQYREAAMLRIWTWRALWVSSGIVFANIVLGLLGFGYATYDYESSYSSDVGVKGFFYSGNELAATYVVLCAFVLKEVWNKRRGWYWMAAILVIVFAVAIATKAAILGALLLAGGIPIFYYRFRIHKMSWKGLLFLFAVSGALVWIAVRIWTILEVAGLADKIAQVLLNQGWMGLIFSGRDQFASATLGSLSQYGSFLDILVGFGRPALVAWSGKQTAEIDPLDLYLWFGVPGIAYGIILYVAFIGLAVRGFRNRNNRSAPAVLLANVILTMASIISGHVVLGGMAGIAWALLNATVIVSAQSARSRVASRSLTTSSMAE